jgi:hypothetical protein
MPVWTLKQVRINIIRQYYSAPSFNLSTVATESDTEARNHLFWLVMICTFSG